MGTMDEHEFLVEVLDASLRSVRVSKLLTH